MMIQDNKNRIFTLQTRNTTYQLKADSNGVVLHTYYGPKVRGGDLSRLIQFADRGFSPNPSEAGNDRTYSLDPGVFRVWGGGFSPALAGAGTC